MSQQHPITLTTKLNINALATGKASAKVKIYAIGVRLATSYEQFEEDNQRLKTTTLW